MSELDGFFEWLAGTDYEIGTYKIIDHDYTFVLVTPTHKSYEDILDEYRSQA